MPLTVRRQKLSRAAAVIAAVLALLLALSVAAIAMEADHDCSGQDCAVCALVRTAVGRFSAVGGALPFVAAACFAALPAVFPAVSIKRAALFFSLIAHKIRLND